MKVVLGWLRRLRWCARLDPLIFSAIVISLLSVVSAAQTSGTCECDQQCPKTRELVTTVWGGAVTILVLSIHIWSAQKQLIMVDPKDRKSTSKKAFNSFVLLFYGVLNPLGVLNMIIYNALWRYCTKPSGFTVLSLLSPWTKDRAKIVYGCELVITVPTVISIPENFTSTHMPSLSEAVVIGRGPEKAQETRDILLHEEGVEVLLQMENVLPPYDQLSVLQGSSGWATIISAVQSVGYTYGVVVRTVQGLPVSPIEVVALTLSIQILIKALLHNIVSTCHRPLHLYLTHDEAQAFVNQCKKYTPHEDPESWALGLFVVIVVLFSGVAIYYIIHMWQTTRRIMVVPIILTLVGFYLQLINDWSMGTTGFEGGRGEVIMWSMLISALVNATSYVFALVLTIKYWKVDRLDAKTSSMLAQIFPYIG